jgi:hypothetical protein
MNRISFDLETLSLRENAHILAIGAYIFTGPDKGETFVANLGFKEQKGTHIDPQTVKFWMMEEQREASKWFFETPTMERLDALAAFKRFCSKFDIDEFWCHANMDSKIINYHFEKCAIPKFPYWASRDVRTLKASIKNPPQIKRLGVYHNCLDDAKNQAHLVDSILKITRKLDG